MQSFLPNPESKKLSAQRAELKAEKEKFAHEIELATEQKKLSTHEQPVVNTIKKTADDGDTKNQKVHMSNGFLVRE